MKSILLSLCLLLLTKYGFSTIYYLSASGNDNNNGTSSTTAWKTIVKLNGVQLQAGDIVKFEGGATFSGPITLGADDLGTSTNPIIITSYGTGRPVINAGTGYGLDAYNTGGIEIRAINFVAGAGNLSSGINFYLDKADVNLQHITIEDVEVSGFHDFGIMLGCTNTTKGYSNVLINRVLSHDNILGGIYTYCWDAFSFDDSNIFINKNIIIKNTKTYNNKGLAGSANHTGSGMIISTFDGALIDSCEAYNNGENNTYGGGGPVGIWFFIVKNGIIQNSESHHNKTQTVDGGGFDLDGGCQNCVIQYCYSHDNMGPGYLLAEYGSNVPYTGNIIRYNISERDAMKARTGGNGSIYLWSTGKGSELINCEIYNNTIYAATNCVLLTEPFFTNVKIRNNIFYSPTGTSLINAAYSPVDSSQAHFVQNNYYSASTPEFTWNNSKYNSLAAWKAVAVTQERVGGTNYGVISDPLFVAGGQGRDGYKLTDISPDIDAGLNLNNIGPFNFYGSASKIGPNQDIGAYEKQGSGTLSFILSNFFAKRQGTGILIQWNVSGEGLVKSYSLESSLDGVSFKPLYQVVSGHMETNSYQYTDTRDNKTIYYRLVIIYQSGQQTISDIISLKHNDSTITILQNPVETTIIFRINNDAVVDISLYNAAGVFIESKRMQPHQGLYVWPVRYLPRGIYYLKAVSQSNESTTYRIMKR